jgi:predicted ATPase
LFSNASVRFYSNQWFLSAARLFVERAEAASPGWKLAACVEEVAAICRRLDGIPLAIELAAARVRMLSAGQIAVRLEDAFSLLSGGSRTALPRHQTLHACIDWSYNLLSEVEQTLLQHLSIFAGGWTLEAAEAVAAGAAGPAAVLDLLGQLVDRSLVIVEQTEDQAVRYRLLETIRQYAQAKLADTGREAAVRDRHLAYFLALAERIEPELRSLGKHVRLNQMAKELGNLRLALAYSLQTDPQLEPRMPALQ